jgi:hypothetical protein
MPLFEVAVLLKPSKAEADRGEGEKLVFGPKAVVASDSQGAAIAAVLGEPEMQKTMDLSRLAVLVRPFERALNLVSQARGLLAENEFQRYKGNAGAYSSNMNWVACSGVSEGGQLPTQTFTAATLVRKGASDA